MTPCSQLGQGTDELNGTNGIEEGEHRGHPRSQQDTTAFQETTGKFIPNFREHSPRVSPLTVSRKSTRALKYNYAQRMRKFTGCVHSKRNLAVERIQSPEPIRIRVFSNSNVEPLCVVKENSQRRSHSHVDQYDRTCPLTHVATPATADRDASITVSYTHLTLPTKRIV